jgi:4-hydroxy-tetrahydrodipicolinate reductase
MVAQHAIAHGHEIVAGVDRGASEALLYPVYASFSDCPASADAVIDFSHPSALDSLLTFARQRHVPAVIATTGMEPEHIQKIQSAAKDVPIFFSFNMSLGVNLLVALSRQAASVLGGNFDIEIVEKHHNKKIDAPSGTAIMLADAVANAVPYQPQFVYERKSVRQRRAPEEIGIHSIRGGTIVGEHEVIFSGMDEIITLSHSARSRGVFATGALSAAAFLQGKPNGLYDMSLVEQP